MENTLSFAFGLISIAVSFGVIRAYGTVLRPKHADCNSWFAHGICIGFSAFALNSLYWAILLRGLRLGGLYSTADWVSSLGAYANVLFLSLLPGWAAYAHLKAKHLALSVREQREWRVYEMVYYPSRKLFLRNCLRRVGPTAKS